MATLYCRKCQGTTTVQPIRSSEKRIGICYRCFKAGRVLRFKETTTVITQRKLVLRPRKYA